MTALGIPVAVMEQLKGGTLVGLTPEARAIFTQAAPKAGIVSWGLRYAASLPNIQIVLSGMSAPDQLEDNLATFTPFRPLTAVDRQIIEEALAVYRRSGAIPCTGCRYCSPCPAGVDIPRQLALYNQLKATGQPFFARLIYDAIPEGQRASACVGCGACKPKCPQGIEIPTALAALAEEFR